MTRMLRYFLLCCFGVVLIPLLARSIEIGPERVRQRALELRNRLNVLSIALQPGYEDLVTLSYLRMGRGATVMSAYVSNGEAGESDLRGEYPNQLAAVLREEATRAVEALGAEAYFLNLPNIASARDTTVVRMKWDRDSVQFRLKKLISDFRPDIILLTGDRSDPQSPRWQVLKSDLISAVRSLRPPRNEREIPLLDPLPRWDVDRVWVETESASGTAVPANELHPNRKKSYRSIAGEAARAYGSIAAQHRLWWGDSAPGAPLGIGRYVLAYSPRQRVLKTLDEGLPRPPSSRYRWLNQEVQSVTAAVLRGPIAPTARDPLLKRIAAAIDTLDPLLARPRDLAGNERRMLLQWKLGLENLRVALLDVNVVHSLTESVVTTLQLTYLTLDTVTGLSPGKTEVLFANVEQGWVIDEDLQRRLPLRLGTPYRLLSPKSVTFTHPVHFYGLEQSAVGVRLPIFVIHRADARHRSFVEKLTVKVHFAPRFVTEVLTPIVRAVDRERLVVRVTNNSRDGVRDFIWVNDSLVRSERSLFRLNDKGGSHVDTLQLTWRGRLDEGTYILPVTIGDDVVAQFGARKFDAAVDGAKRAAVIAPLEGSPTAEALRRLGIGFSRYSAASGMPDALSKYDVVIIDRRALTLDSTLKEIWAGLLAFADQGGHLVIFSQDAEVWMRGGFLDDLQLSTTSLLDEFENVTFDESHPLFRHPNTIVPEDWSGWLFRRAHNVVSGPIVSRADGSARTVNGDWLLLTWRMGSGRITYVDLALQPQLLNIHPGAFRLLANIVSY